MAILTINSSITSPMPSDGTMILLDKFQVDTWLLESVQDHLDAIFPYLLEGHDYTSQDLLGEDFLADMAMPRHLAMLCLKHLAAMPDACLIEQSYTGCETSYFQVAS